MKNYNEDQMSVIIETAILLGERVDSGTNYIVNAHDIVISDGTCTVTEVCINHANTPYYGDSYIIYVDPDINFSGRVRD